jgi:hypothetical protein
MAANAFNNTAKITKQAMNVLRNNLVLVPRVNRTYEKEFHQGNGKIGDTVSVRIPGYGTVRRGKVASPAGYNESYVPLTVAQIGADLKFSSKELLLNVEDPPEFERSVLGPQLATLINQVEADGFALSNQLSGFTGTPGTKPTDLSAFLDAYAQLAEFACPLDDEIYAYLAPRSQSSMVNGLKGLFQDSTEISKQYKKGVMGTAAGMNFMTSQNTIVQTTGTYSGASIAMNGATAEGASTLAINTWGGATDTLNKGDIIAIAGVYAVNPVSKLSTGQLMQFVVTATTSASANAMAALPISPSIYTSASGAKQNVTALPLTTAAVSIYGVTTSATYSAKASPINLVMHRDCLGFAAVDMPLLDPTCQTRVRDNQLGMSVRLTKWLDGVNDDLLFRLDLMVGWCILRDKFGCRVQG